MDSAAKSSGSSDFDSVSITFETVNTQRGFRIIEQLFVFRTPMVRSPH
jgi:hypothetical protein